MAPTGRCCATLNANDAARSCVDGGIVAWLETTRVPSTRRPTRLERLMRALKVNLAIQQAWPTFRKRATWASTRKTRPDERSVKMVRREGSCPRTSKANLSRSASSRHQISGEIGHGRALSSSVAVTTAATSSLTTGGGGGATAAGAGAARRGAARLLRRRRPVDHVRDDDEAPSRVVGQVVGPATQRVRTSETEVAGE